MFPSNTFRSLLHVLAIVSLSACSQADDEYEISRNVPESIPSAYLLFYSDGSHEAPNSEKLLLGIAAAMLIDKSSDLKIVAFRSSTESVETDAQRLSVIVDFLLDKGVESSRISTLVRGVSRLGSSASDESISRRVEIVLSPKQ